MTPRTKDRGLAYLRRSTTKQDNSLPTQLAWAQKQAQEHGVTFEGTDADLERMLSHGLTHYKDICLDDGVSGSTLNRPGLEAFRQAALRNKSVSHVFIYLSDRLARPETGSQGMRLEEELQYTGLTVVFGNRVAKPHQHGQQNIGEEIQALVEYSQNGDFLNKLSQRIVETQVGLAKQGHWSGGPAPYGFGRFLVDGKGEALRELSPGEKVRQKGYHVEIRPTDPAKIKIWLYILDLKANKQWGDKRIARHLNELKIPSPSGGTWRNQTVHRLCASRTIIAELEYGKMSVGKHRRVSVDGPRLLNDKDFNEDGTIKAVQTSADQVVRTAANYEPCADPGVFHKCQQVMEGRGQNQRGIPRGIDLAKYPLSCRITDATEGCGATFYGNQVEGRTRYACGRYLRSNGRECAPHAVDAEAALQFVSQLFVQLVARCGGRAALRERLREALVLRQATSSVEQVTAQGLLEKQLASHRKELTLVQQNLARATSEAAFKAVEAEFDHLNQEVRELELQLSREDAAGITSQATSPDQVIEEAMQLLSKVGSCVEDPASRERLGELLRRLDVRLWLNFMDNPRGKKPKRVLQSGIITAGPIEPDTVLNQLRGGRPPVAGDGDGSVSHLADTSSTTIRQPKSRSTTKDTHGVPSRACHSFGRGNFTSFLARLRGAVRRRVGILSVCVDAAAGGVAAARVDENSCGKERVGEEGLEPPTSAV